MQARWSRLSEFKGTTHAMPQAKRRRGASWELSVAVSSLQRSYHTKSNQIMQSTARKDGQSWQPWLDSVSERFSVNL